MSNSDIKPYWSPWVLKSTFKANLLDSWVEKLWDFGWEVCLSITALTSPIGQPLFAALDRHVTRKQHDGEDLIIFFWSSAAWILLQEHQDLIPELAATGWTWWWLYSWCNSHLKDEFQMFENFKRKFWKLDFQSDISISFDVSCHSGVHFTHLLLKKISRKRYWVRTFFVDL